MFKTSNCIFKHVKNNINKLFKKYVQNWFCGQITIIIYLNLSVKHVLINNIITVYVYVVGLETKIYISNTNIMFFVYQIDPFSTSFELDAVNLANSSPQCTTPKYHFLGKKQVGLHHFISITQHHLKPTTLTLRIAECAPTPIRTAINIRIPDCHFVVWKMYRECSRYRQGQSINIILLFNLTQ